MKRRGLQLNRNHRRMLYAVSLALLVSGAVWAWIHRLDDAGQASDSLRQVNPWVLKIHGWAALGFAVLFGSLIPVHIRHSWHARKNRRNGVFFLSAVSLLTLSGYALYYLGDEAQRNAASRFHLWLGLAAPLLLFWHIRNGRKSTMSSDGFSGASRKAPLKKRTGLGWNGQPVQ